MKEITIQNPADAQFVSISPRDSGKQSRDLAKIARSNIVGSDGDVEYEFNGSSYDDLSSYLWEKFVRQAKSCTEKHYEQLATLPTVAHGFNILGKILSYAPAAFASYCQQTGAQLDLAMLGKILHDSKDILRLFAKRDNSSNVNFETAFGLRQFKPYYDEVPFVIGMNDNGQIAFLPAQNTLGGVLSEVYREQRVRDENAQCPAYAYVLGIVWDEAIDICETNPRLFPASLGLSE